MFRWFEKNFCDAKCLTSYYKQNTTKCHECTVDMVFQTKFVLKTRSDLWIFCSDECFTRNTTVNVYCEFCSNQISNKSKVGGKNFCSADCTDKWLQSGSNQTVSCPDCGISSEDHKQINIHGAKHGLCGESCFSVIENGMRTEYGKNTLFQLNLNKIIELGCFCSYLHAMPNEARKRRLGCVHDHGEWSQQTVLQYNLHELLHGDQQKGRCLRCLLYTGSILPHDSRLVCNS